MAHISIGSSPWGEHCAQVGSPGYDLRGPSECRVYIEQLKRHYTATHGLSLPCVLSTKSHPHDFGTYYEVQADFEEGTPAEDAAYWLESNSPELWDDRARKALGLPAEQE